MPVLVCVVVLEYLFSRQREIIHCDHGESAIRVVRASVSSCQGDYVGVRGIIRRIGSSSRSSVDSIYVAIERHAAARGFPSPS